MAAPAYRTSAAGGATSGTSNRTCTITPAVGDLFIVICVVSTNTNATPTCTDDNGGTYDRILTAACNTGQDNMMSVFVRTSLLANTTSTVVTPNTGSNTSGEVVVIAYSNMTRLGSAAVRSSGSQAAQAGGTTPAPALNQSALTTNPTIGGVMSTGTLTPNASWTERQDVGQNTPTIGIEACTRDSGFTGTTVTWGGASASPFASFIIELDGNKQLACTTGSFSFTGNAATLTFTSQRTLAAATGAFAFTGQSANLNRGEVMTAATGAFAFTGNAATLRFGYGIAAAAGAFSVTGAAALRQLSKTAGTCDVAFTGRDATLSTGAPLLPAGIGSFVVNGGARFHYSNEPDVIRGSPRLGIGLDIPRVWNDEEPSDDEA